MPHSTQNAADQTVEPHLRIHSSSLSNTKWKQSSDERPNGNNQMMSVWKREKKYFTVIEHHNGQSTSN